MSAQNLVKASRLPVSKVRQFLHSKPSYTKFTLATRTFARTEAFLRFNNEIRCTDLACVEKLAGNNESVKFLLIRQDWFDRTTDRKRKKIKNSKESVRAI